PIALGAEPGSSGKIHGCEGVAQIIPEAALG
ncbi:unnamed protein product, partial [marine sediment metagenome]